MLKNAAGRIFGHLGFQSLRVYSPQLAGGVFIIDRRIRSGSSYCNWLTSDTPASRASAKSEQTQTTYGCSGSSRFCTAGVVIVVFHQSLLQYFNPFDVCFN